MKKIFESKNCIIEYDGNKTIFKTLKHKTVSQAWLDDYNKLRNNNPTYVEVFEVLDDHTLSMEYVKELDNLEHVLKEPRYWPRINKQFVLDAVESFHMAFTDGLRVSRLVPDDQYFLHTDLKIANLIVDENMKVRIIDPDSYTWVPRMQWTEKYYMNQVNMAFCLQRYFNDDV